MGRKGFRQWQNVDKVRGSPLLFCFARLACVTTGICLPVNYSDKAVNFACFRRHFTSRSKEKTLPPAKLLSRVSTRGAWQAVENQSSRLLQRPTYSSFDHVIIISCTNNLICFVGWVQPFKPKIWWQILPVLPILRGFFSGGHVFCCVNARMNGDQSRRK